MIAALLNECDVYYYMVLIVKLLIEEQMLNTGVNSATRQLVKCTLDIMTSCPPKNYL